ncbi:MAG: hypothetical protein DMD72_04695 [Gemmatimonadetes bacterium]|nr:MAG: hypothetical protein DMD72_04695 [Gemmatimonadota bacterium]
MGVIMNRTISRGVGLGLAMMGIFSCSENNVTGADRLNTDSLTADASRVATVTVSLASSSIAVGDTTRATATLLDYQNRPIARTVTWSSSNTAVATVDTTGLVTGVAAGTAVITASRGTKSGSATLTVTGTSPPPTTNPGTVTDLKVSAIDSTGVTLTFTQVNDGTGKPAQYDVRYAVAPISWGSATSVTSGTCAVPVTGTAIGSPLTCTVLGLTPATSYEFQLVSFRGTLNYNAVFGGLSNVVAATTKASTPPPPPPPPGGTLLFEEDFENSNIASRGWYDDTNVELSTTEHITGSTASAQYHWLVGATTPTSGGAQRHKFTPTSSVYLSYYVKYSTNYVGSGQAYHPHEFYILSNLDGDYDGPSQSYMDLYVEQNYQNGGRPRIAMQDNRSVNYNYGPLPNNLIGVTEDRSTGGCNGVVESNIFSECFNFGSYWYNDKQLTGPVEFQPNPGPGYKSDWNFVEAYFQLNTIVNGVGQANGVIQYWFNGALVIDRHDILFRTGAHPTMQMDQLIIAPYIGDGSPVDQYMWVDNLRIATGRIP